MHSAFAGFTGFTSGVVNNHPVMIPVDYISSLGTRTIVTDTDMEYLSLLASTGQPSFKESTSRMASKTSSHQDHHTTHVVDGNTNTSDNTNSTNTGNH